MSPLGLQARAVVAVAIAVLLAVGAAPPTVRAQTAPDRSDVVLVLDFSASILQDAANRNRFGAALERIAGRVEQISSDLVAGDTTVTIVQFAAKAVDLAGCTDLRLLGSAESVARFARCLRSVAAAYRKGLDPTVTRTIGIDTNYVAAMELAAKHLPTDAVRPTLILFTDGKHDVRGVPASQVPVTRDRLFGTRSPFALLPVGMGLDPTQRGALENGLLRLRLVSEMPPCVTGQTFDWPQVVFQSPDDAGNAVAVALQNATCTFTVEPSPTPQLTTGAAVGVQATATDGAIVLTWAPPAASSDRVVDYRARCRAGQGDWIESKEGVSPERRATVGGLTNGVAYQCEVAAVGAASVGAWTAAAGLVTPVARPAPAAPSTPPVEAPDQSVGLFQPILAILGIVLAGGLLAAFIALYRGRTRGYVVAVVDVVHSVNLGHGSSLGIGFVRDPVTKQVTGIVADRGAKPDIRIHQLRGGSFQITDRTGRRVVPSGERIVISDGRGGRHDLVLHAFATNAAAAGSSRS